jgi:hypothetical protein
MGAPPWDFDEIVDDAIGLFGVEIRPESRGYDARLLGDVCQSGIEVREGVLLTSAPNRPEGWQCQYVWFRKQTPRGGKTMPNTD